jgi:phospholipid/cholesterol/gamma-HCH transport system substrate-binding protein
MVTLGDRDDELSDLLVNLRRFVSGLSGDREAILGSLESISDLSVQTSDLVAGIRSPLARDVQELRKVAGTLDANRAELDRAIQVLPIKLEKIGRTAVYGSWFNFYLCNFKGRVQLPGNLTVPLDYDTGSARCDLG